MVVLGQPKLPRDRGIQDLGSNRAAPGIGQGRAESASRQLGQFALFRRGTDNQRTVLTAPVVTLPVTLRGVVIFPKDFQQFPGGGRAGIKYDSHSFRMPGGSGADFLVAGRGLVSCHVAHSRVDYPRLGPKYPFHPPEAAHREIDYFVGFRPRSGYRGVEDGVSGCWVRFTRCHHVLQFATLMA